MLEVMRMYKGKKNSRKLCIVGIVAAVIAWVAFAPLFYVSAFANLVPYDGSAEGIRTEWRFGPLTGFAHFYHAWGLVNASGANVRVVWHITTENISGTSRYERVASCAADSNGFFDVWTYGYDYWLTAVSAEVYAGDALVWSRKVE